MRKFLSFLFIILLLAGNVNTVLAASENDKVLNVGRFFIYSDAIVMDPSKDIYAVSGVPNPPKGGVFIGCSLDGSAVAGYIDMPSTCWSAINLLEIYKRTGNLTALERARTILDFMYNSLYNADLFGATVKLIPNRWEYKGAWIPNKECVHFRTIYHSIWAFVEGYDVLRDIKYKEAAESLIKTAGLGFNNIKQRISAGEIPTWMAGSVYNTFNKISEEALPQYTLSWTTFDNTVADVLYKAINRFIEVIGDNSYYDWEWNDFTVSAMLDEHKIFLTRAINEHGLLMPATGLPYHFYHYDWGDETQNGMYIPRPKNWDWVGDSGGVWGDTWWTSDAAMWVAKGLAYMGLTDKARDMALSLIVRKLNRKNEVLFYDRYDFYGQPLPHDKSTSICVTALLGEVMRVIGLPSAVCPYVDETLNKYEIKSENKLVDGGYSWDPTTNSNIEVKTTGEIVYYLLTNILPVAVEVDKEPPVIKDFRIANGASVIKTASIPLSIIALDNNGVSGLKMRFSNDGVTWTPLVNYSIRYTLTGISFPLGYNMLYVEVVDEAGNIDRDCVNFFYYP